MNTLQPHRPTRPLTILSFCLLILSINGFIGGFLMLRDPNGAPMGMPVSYLQATPFENFTIPGWLLIGIWGSGSLITLIGLWRHPKTPVFTPLTAWTHEHWSWVFSVLMGLGLMLWLAVQVFTLPEMAPPQYILFVFALVMIGVPLIPQMRLYYRL